MSLEQQTKEVSVLIVRQTPFKAAIIKSNWSERAARKGLIVWNMRWPEMNCALIGRRAGAAATLAIGNEIGLMR